MSNCKFHDLKSPGECLQGRERDALAHEDVGVGVARRVPRRPRVAVGGATGADLSAADLRSADIRSANLRDAHLRNADLSGANLSGANLWRA